MKKRRKDMKPMELAADTAEKNFDKLRKELKAKRNLVKKTAGEFIKAARAIQSEGRLASKMAAKLWLLFEARTKKKVRDALSLKKENGYQLPLGQVGILIKNVEPELMDEVHKRLQEAPIKVAASSSEESHEEDDEQTEAVKADGDGRRSLVLNAINYVMDHGVDSWNARPGNATARDLVLSRPQLVHLWKKTNTRGGSFQLKKINHVAGARLVYEAARCELHIMLTVVEGEPSDDQ